MFPGVAPQILRNNHGFTKLDLSRCFISDEHFVCLAQALAWNVRVEEVGAGLRRVRRTVQYGIMNSPQASHISLATPIVGTFTQRCETRIDILIISGTQNPVYRDLIIVQVRAKECIFTNVIMSALADVITVNHRIRAIDIRRGRGMIAFEEQKLGSQYSGGVSRYFA